MADDANATPGANDEAVETQNPAGNQEEQQEQEKLDKTYTQEGLDKMLQAESDRRFTQALKTFKEKELPGPLEGAKTEAEKLAKMTADQKAEHQKKKADEELAKRETDLVKREFEATKRELKAQVIEIFAEKNIPTYLCDIVNYADAETCGASMELIEKAFRKAVEDGVNARLKQNPPAAASPNKVDSFLAALKKEQE